MASTPPIPAPVRRLALPDILVKLGKTCRETYVERLLRFEGRASRSGFWLAQLGGTAAAALGFIFVQTTVKVAGLDTAAPPLAILLLSGFPLWFTAGLVSSGTRRLRDAGLPPLLVLFLFAPYFTGLLVMIPMWLLGRKEDSFCASKRNA